MGAGDACHIAAHGAERALEFAAFRWPASGFPAAEWPIDAGGAVRDGTGRALLLHFAPGRWLAPGPAPDLEERLGRAAHGGAGTLLDVTGKWARMSITGAAAARLLAGTIDIHALLAGRECAAALLFDCPAIVARSDQGFETWLQASYVVDFLATTARQRAAPDPPGRSNPAQLHG